MNDAKIIAINKQRFVAGLYWQTLTRPRDYLREAREIGKREKMDVVAIRRGRVLQAGFATRNTAGSGAYSFVATLAGALGDDWIAVFDIGDGRYAIAAAKNGAIIPGCDDIGPRAQIEESLRTNFNLHQFTQVICPAEFDFGGEERDLGQLLQSHKLRKEYKLQPLSGARTLLSALLVVALVLLMVGGGTIGFLMYRKHQQQQAAAAAAAAAATEQRRLEELKAASGQDVTPVALTHPWASQPVVREMRSACVDAMRAFPLSIGGWLVDSALCHSGMVQATYRRMPTATVNGFTTHAQAQGYRIAMIDEAGETGTLSVSLGALRAGGDDALLDMGQIGNAVRSLLQSRSSQFTLSVKDVTPAAPPVLPGQEAPPAPPAPDWQTQSLTITGRQTPGDMLTGLEDLPGLRLLSVSVKRSQSELEWSLTGEINGK